MTPTPAGQNRLLPYLLVILVLLLAYVAYTRFVQRPRPAAVVQAPPAVAPTAGSPTPSPEVSPEPAASPAPATSPAAAASPAVPPRPSGRANPFAALVGERPAQGAPSPPPAPTVPPPFFPGGQPPVGQGPGRPGAAAPEAKAVGVLLQGGSAVGIVEIAQKTYIVREGEMVEGFRVERIQDGRITLRRGDERVELKLGGGEQR